MSRYIAVNEFYDKMYEWVRMHGGIIRNEMQAILEAVSYIDIVRCKECKYEPICNRGVQHTTHEPTSVTIGYKSVDFCSYAERKESE